MPASEIGLTVVVVLVLVALAFDFMNGFHDAANSIATVVSTGVLKPHQAVCSRRSSISSRCSCFI
jgi:PiT family inorganic phosphate transporter